MPRKAFKGSAEQVYSIAHSAQCKLSMAVDSPDRNLRFVLGHAFLLDNMLLRVAEIEEMNDVEPGVVKNVLSNEDEEGAQPQDEQEGQSGSLAGGKVSFNDDSSTDSHREKSRITPPTAMPAAGSDSDTRKQDVGEEDKPVYSDQEEDEEGDGLGLMRFASASAAPPRMIPSSEDDSDSDDDGPVSPPSLPADFDYHTLMEGQEDTELGDLYESVRECPCHGHQDVKAKGVWNVKGQDVMGDGNTRKRIAVMRVEA